jgi:serine/threonine protein kinase
MQTMEEKPVLKHNPLPRRKRAAWDAIIATEGVKMGLDGCRAFLENKIVNDIFYEGLYKGRPCVVKCSSRAPVSIKNEYDMSRRLAAVDPRACAEALDLWTAPDGRRAFVVLRRLPGPSLTDILSRDVGEDEAVAIIEDMIRIAEALKKSGIVWRDIISDNFIRDDEGHFRLIDAQFAVDRADFREIPFLRSHWSYRTIVFANHPMMAGRGWNDAAMMLFFVWKLSASPPGYLFTLLCYLFASFRTPNSEFRIAEGVGPYGLNGTFLVQFRIPNSELRIAEEPVAGPLQWNEH